MAERQPTLDLNLEEIKEAIEQEQPPTDIAPPPAEPADNEDQTNNPNQPEGNPKRKRKVAMFLSYVGHGYQGMQRNPGAKTIEEDLFKAIHAAGGISDANADERGPTKIHWMRAARTDKGVSAVGQVVSFKLILDPPGVLDRINANLPDQIRVMGYFRVTNGFDSRKHCDKRRYEYILPAWAFAPPPPAATTTEGGQGEAEGGEGTEIKQQEFVFDDECVKRLDRILNNYKGTHNFHNYTIRTSHLAPDVKRYILSFGCEGVFNINGKPWVRMVVVGQSFMLHQIRKMIGMAVAVFKNVAPAHCQKLALTSHTSLNVPMAPELGLFLDSCYYDSYNAKWGKQHGPISSEVYAPVIDTFKNEQLYPHIATRDETEGVNFAWFEQLTEENYKFSQWQQFEAEKAPRTELTKTDKRRLNKPVVDGKRQKIDIQRQDGTTTTSGGGGGGGSKGAGTTSVGGNDTTNTGTVDTSMNEGGTGVVSGGGVEEQVKVVAEATNGDVKQAAAAAPVAAWNPEYSE